MSEGLNRREVLAAGAAVLAIPGCTRGERNDSGEMDTALEDRHEMLIDALLAEDLDILVDASREELDALGADKDLVAVVPDCKHILYTAGWWGYMKKNALRSGRPFKLPQSVRDNLHWQTPVEKDPLAGTYGIC